MIVAAALFNQDISPRLDFCDGFLILDSVKMEWMIKHIKATKINRYDMLNMILKLSIETLLTGGVRRCDYFYLTQSGVKVLAGLTGPAKDRIEEFLLCPRLVSKP